MYYAFICSVSFVSAVLLTAMGGKIMQILQLSSYRVRGVADWCKQTRFNYPVRYMCAAFFSFISMLVYVGCFWRFGVVRYLGLLFYVGFTLAFIFLTGRQKNKTPLKFTPRIARLSLMVFVLTFFASFGLSVAARYIVIRYSILGVLPVLVPPLVVAAHCILWPLEQLNNLRYLRRARKKLAAMPELIRVGITGSYGKTTAKHILAAMLAQKYKVCASPQSYNTPMGLTRTVNDVLTPEDSVLIAEMGARYVGDIATLCRLVQPDIGIVTAVGNQHLQTFGSIEAVAATKYELIEGVKEGGLGILAADNEYTRAMAEKATCEKLLCGREGDVRYCDVAYGNYGTKFTLVYGDERTEVSTKLLGRHIPQLCTLCAAAAFRLGVRGEQIRDALSTLEPVPHRLQLLENNGTIVLDDAYNANPAGAANALEVLGGFAGVRIVVTPGLVELGESEEQENFALGKLAAGCADYACFVGARAAALKRGAVEGGMVEENIFVCATLDEAVARTTTIEGNKVILFENDLPDNY